MKSATLCTCPSKDRFEAAPRLLCIPLLLSLLLLAMGESHLVNAQPIHVDFVKQFAGKIVDLAVGGQGEIYLLDSDGIVTVIDSPTSPRTILLQENVNRRFSFGKARAIAVDRASNIFVCDESKGFVAKFNRNGQYISHFGPASTDSEVLNHPVALAADKFGRVFAADKEKVVHIYNNQGIYLGRLTGFERPIDIGCDELGNIYVLESKEPALFAYDLNLSPLAQRALGATAEFDISVPGALFVEPDGTVYVTDLEACQVSAFSPIIPSDSSVVCYTRIGIKGEGRGEFRAPSAVAVDGDGQLLVVDEKNRNVQVFSLSGLAVQKRRLDQPPVQPLPVTVEWVGEVYHSQSPGSAGLESFAVDDTGNLYCVDTQTHSISVYDTEGRHAVSFGKEGKELGRMKRPRGAVVSGEKDLFVVDSGNNRIQQWSRTGVYQRRFGKKGKKPEQYDDPSDMVLDANENLVISDKNNNRVQVISQAGSVITVVGEVGGEPLHKPVSVAVDGQEKLYVIEEDRRWVRFLELQNGSGGSIGEKDQSPFVDPVSLAVDERGTLFVLDAQTGVYAFDKGARLMAHFASLGDLVGQFKRPTQIRISAAGEILISDSIHNRISRFRLGNIAEGAVAGRVVPSASSGSVALIREEEPIATDSLSYDGSFIIGHVPPGQVSVQVSAPGFTQSNEVKAQIVAGGVVQCEPVQLELNGTISGRIVPNAPQAAVVLLKNLDPVSETVADPADGSYSFADVIPGEYAITVTVPGFASSVAPKHVRIESGTEYSDTTYLRRPGSIAGVVTPPEAGAMGTVFFDTISVARFAVRSDNGVFETPELYPETYTLVLSAEAFIDHQLVAVEVAEGERLDVGVVELDRVRTTTAEAIRLLDEAERLHLAADFEGAQAILDSVITTEEMATHDLAQAYLWLAYSYFPFSELKEMETTALVEALNLHPTITVDESFSPAFLQDFEAVKDSLGLQKPED